MTTLHWSELEQMRASVSAPANIMNEKTFRRTEKKKLSEERVKNWPNTLDALRLKKENFARVKAEEEEQKRLEIDKQEADLRKSMRLESIQRATALLYEQTDKMKVLKSQLLYADVLHDRKYQIEVNNQRKESERIEAQKAHEEMMRQLQEAKIKEAEELEKRRNMVKTVTSVRQMQLEEVKRRKEEEVTEMRAIGQKLREDAEEDFKREVLRQKEQMEKIRETNRTTLIANKQIREAKEELKRKEKEEEEKMKKKAEEIENRKVILKELDHTRFMKAQVMRQAMIDRALQRLMEQEDTHAKIFEKQVEEKRTKEDAELSQRQSMRDQEKEAIRQQRQQMIERRRAQKAQEQEEAHKIAEAVRQKYLEETEKEKLKQQKTRELSKSVKEVQFATAVNARRKKIEEKISEIEKDRLIQAMYEKEDEKYAEVCQSKIQEYVQAGKPVLTLMRALETTQPDLLAAPLDKSKSAKNKEKKKE